MSSLPILDAVRFSYYYGGVSKYDTSFQRKRRRIPFSLFMYAQKGSFHCYGASGKRVRVDEGEAVLMPEMTDYHTDTLKLGAVTEAWMMVRFRCMGTIDACQLMLTPDKITGATAQHMGRLCKHLVKLHERKDGDDDAWRTGIASQSLGMQWLDCLSEVSTLNQTVIDSMQTLSRLEPVLQYMQANFNKLLTRDDLAGILGLTPQHLHVLFKSVFGVAPVDYLIRLRIQEAQRQLMTTSKKVSDVGLDVGFGDPFHFSRQFKHHCGVSPRAYREQGGWGVEG